MEIHTLKSTMCHQNTASQKTKQKKKYKIKAKADITN